MMKRALTVVVALFVTNALAMDQEMAEKAAKVRQSVLTVTGWNVAPMAAMAKERIPYDAAQFQQRAERIAFMLDMVPDAFTPDTREAVLETEALDVIWEDFEEFRRLAAQARDRARAAGEAAAEGEFRDAQAAFMKMGEACKACHDRFREED